MIVLSNIKAQWLNLNPELKCNNAKCKKYEFVSMSRPKNQGEAAQEQLRSPPCTKLISYWAF